VASLGQASSRHTAPRSGLAALTAAAAAAAAAAATCGGAELTD